MPRAKKQKTMRDSNASAEDLEGHSSDSAIEFAHLPEANKSKKAKSKGDHSQDVKKTTEDKAKPAPYEYVCFHRPLFDVKGENWLKWSNDADAHVDEEEVFDELYKPMLEKEEEAGIPGALSEKHPEHRWVMMWNALVKQEWLKRRAIYCDPDFLGLNLYNDWKSWGLTEILENMMVEFNNAYRSKGPNHLEDMWVIVSAVGFWFNLDDNFGCFTGSEDGYSVRQLVAVMGSAVLTVLAAIEKAGELKPDSRFLDLALVIGYYLEFCHDLPAYGCEGESVMWCKHLIEYFKKGNLDPAKALATTKHHIEKIEKGEDDWGNEEVLQDQTTKDSEKENVNPQATKDKLQSPKSATGKRKRGSANAKSGASQDAKKEKDNWGWERLFKKYKKEHHPKMGGNHYDITKMSRAERKEAAYDGKDPFADVPAKDLEEDLVVFE